MSGQELHHAVPQCLLRLRDAAEGQMMLGDEPCGAWLEWTDEAGRWGVSVEIPRGDLAKLVERSAVVLDREKHRLLHGSDFQRWGRRGGRETARRYGSSWMAALALKRWGRITVEDLDAARVVR